MLVRGSTPEAIPTHASVPTAHKTTKIPDPPMLTDSKVECHRTTRKPAPNPPQSPTGWALGQGSLARYGSGSKGCHGAQPG
ncbi:uncharacterized protein ASPGLDRAFT_42300 [Aspergillus glaucus CBS 516.65]|uniref:Uncharacterized protein n=1 Tax=Aspergillus glaucus CBS 516.65 TaxID=1160497 RepID=A0A1L9VXV8_ASPGL|nr:hypothetical protein ASPGLDRAFT_42300 [Aspergillus glaucus CBS 516.65]OJJ88719.1 hypothetical protein ASPGLDRAFT_42300 [Aspergillus glaucus CBS 516.65]